jgi:hypothetical protein
MSSIELLLVTAERRVLWNWWFVAGGVVATLICLPNLIWMWQHHFPHLELLANIKRNQRNVSLSLEGRTYYLVPAYAMASQRWGLFLYRGPKGWKDFDEVWPRLKSWD